MEREGILGVRLWAQTRHSGLDGFLSGSDTPDKHGGEKEKVTSNRLNKGVFCQA